MCRGLRGRGGGFRWAAKWPRGIGGRRLREEAQAGGQEGAEEAEEGAEAEVQKMIWGDVVAGGGWGGGGEVTEKGRRSRHRFGSHFREQSRQRGFLKLQIAYEGFQTWILVRCECRTPLRKRFSQGFGFFALGRELLHEGLEPSSSDLDFAAALQSREFVNEPVGDLCSELRIGMTKRHR